MTTPQLPPRPVLLLAPIVVLLDDEDLAYGTDLGTRRHERANALGYCDYFDPRTVGLDPLANEIAGGLAEVAVARVLRRPRPHAPVGHEQPDVDPDIDVRSTHYPNGYLIHRDRDRPVFRSVLVTGTAPVLTLQGWLWGWQARRPEWIAVPGPRRRRRWHVPQEALCRNLDQLAAKLRAVAS